MPSPPPRVPWNPPAQQSGDRPEPVREPVAPDLVQALLNERLARSLGPLSMALVAILLADGLANLLTLPAARGRGILAVDVGAALVFLAVLLWERRRGVAPRVAHPLAVGLVGVILVNLQLSAAIDPPGNVVIYSVLILVGTATVLLDPRWFAGALALQAAFLAGGSLAGTPGLAPGDAALPLLESGLLAVAIFYVRYRTTRDHEVLQVRLERRAAELARSNAELEQFAYVASHDLQEPLRQVASYVQLLEKRYGDELDDDARSYIGYAVEGVKRMRNLIRDLLALGRAGAGDPAKQEVDLDQALADVLADLATAVEEQGGAVTHDPLPTVVGNAVELREVLRNLLTNALKFHRDGEPPRVHVSAKRDGRWWTITVADDGIGIHPDHQERIFVVFQRLHPRDRYPGTGIGLALCKKIVDRHGGRLWVESAPGGGSRFRFTVAAPRGNDGGPTAYPWFNKP